MNIVIMAEYVRKSGVGVYVDSLCSELKKTNNVFLIAGEYVFDANEDIFVKHNISKAGIVSLIKNVFAMRKFFKANNIDIVQMNHRRCAFLMKVYNSIFWFSKMKCCWILHTQKIRSSLPYRMVTYTGNKVIAISSEVKNFLIEKLRVKESKIQLILNGIDNSNLTPLTDAEKQEIKNKYGIEKDKIVVCLHGRLDKVKGLDVLINGVNLLPQEYKDKIVVVCSGDTNCEYYNYLVDLINSYNLEKNFVFTGWTKTRDIFGISDLYVAPSRREGFSLSVIESFFMKVPCVRTRTGGYLDTKDCSDVIEIDMPEDITKKLIAFVDNPSIYDDMVEKAYNFAIENCTTKIMAEKTLQLFESIKGC